MFVLWCSYATSTLAAGPWRNYKWSGSGGMNLTNSGGGGSVVYITSSIRTVRLGSLQKGISEIPD